MQTIVGESLYGQRKRSRLNLILNVVVAIFAVVLLGEVLFNSFFISIYVEGDSMLPTLIGADDDRTAGGDYIFVNTHEQPDYGDIVVLFKEDNITGATYNIIKRAIAFGGDTVKMERGKLFLKKKGEADFTEIPEPYVAPERNLPEKLSNSFAEHTVEEGCIFLLGDNRNESHDSRADGDYPIGRLVGVAPQWAIDNKGTITGLYTFFKFTLPGFLGFRR